MKFKVPIKKDVRFAQELFALISEHVSNLASDHDKFPNKIIFTGSLGRELFEFIKEKEWNFKGFDLESAGGLVNALTFKYDAPFTQYEGRYGTMFDGGGLSNQTISGIPGPETIKKIVSSYASPSFMIERTVRPEKKILLSRE